MRKLIDLAGNPVTKNVVLTETRKALVSSLIWAAFASTLTNVVYRIAARKLASNYPQQY